VATPSALIEVMVLTLHSKFSRFLLSERVILAAEVLVSQQNYWTTCNQPLIDVNKLTVFATSTLKSFCQVKNFSSQNDKHKFQNISLNTNIFVASQVATWLAEAPTKVLSL
jgi:hypothetical protein